MYRYNGEQIQTAYGVNGEALAQAYDVYGNPLITTYDLAVMTYNVQHFSGRNSNQAMQERILQAYQPDIVGLQELGSGTMPALGVTLFADYENQFLGSDTNKSGIVSKYALTNPAFTAYTQKASETRGYEKTYITVNGKQIALFNTHVETISSMTVHNAQLKQLFDDMQTETSFIALGDFNAETHSKTDSEYINGLQQFVDAGYHMVNWKDGFTDSWFNGTTVTGSNYKCPCDNIITSQDINIVRWVYDPIKLEYESGAIDHIAVVAYLEVTSS